MTDGGEMGNRFETGTTGVAMFTAEHSMLRKREHATRRRRGGWLTGLWQFRRPRLPVCSVALPWPT